MNKAKKIGIIGCGEIGTEVALAIDKGEINARLSAICDRSKKKTQELKRVLKCKPEILDIENLICKCDLIFESARFDIVPEIIRKCIKHGKDVVIMSVGGIIIEPNLLEEVENSNSNLYIPSGAIGGIDALKAMKICGIDSVELITEKPSEAFGLGNSKNSKDKIVLYKGSVLNAIKKYPLNINIAATISIAGVGVDNTMVKIISNKKTLKNLHTLIVESPAGNLKVICKNNPSSKNPKTSYLAPLSAISLLKNICSNIKIGT